MTPNLQAHGIGKTMRGGNAFVATARKEPGKKREVPRLSGPPRQEYQ